MTYDIGHVNQLKHEQNMFYVRGNQLITNQPFIYA